MKLLVYDKSYRNNLQAFEARPDVEPLIIADDGSVRRPDGSSINDPRPEVVWLCRELLVGDPGPLREIIRITHQSGSVQWVHSFAAGYEHPLFQGILDAGMRFSNTDSHGVAIAEFVIAEVLAAFQPIAERRALQAERNWKRLSFREVYGSQWLILGYGSIGRHVAARAHGLGARITGIRRTPQPDGLAERVVSPDALMEEAARADVLVICAAANDANAHLIDAQVLAAMKPDAVLVNIARGSIIDEQALIAALDAGRPGTAILDVFETEPLPEHSPLWTHPGVRMAAHCSGSTLGTGLRSDEVFLEHLDAWRAGQPLRLEVTPTSS